MLGADGIYVELAGEAHELRPSLRASMRLVRRHQFHGLLAAAHDFNVTIIADMLREAGIKPALLLAEIGAHGLGEVRNRLTGPLVAFVWAIAGVDPDNIIPASAVTTAKLPTPDEAFARLFGIATGWLGWAPEEAWNATPAEISAAQAGRTDLITDVLKAVFGTTDKDQNANHQSVKPYTREQLQQIEELGYDPAFDREALHALKAKL